MAGSLFSTMSHLTSVCFISAFVEKWHVFVCELFLVHGCVCVVLPVCVVRCFSTRSFSQVFRVSYHFSSPNLHGLEEETFSLES